MPIQLANFVRATITETILEADTSIEVEYETSSIYLPPPTPDSGFSISLKIVDDIDNPQFVEIITYSGVTGSNPYTLTGVNRGVGVTSAQKWAGGSYLESFSDAELLSTLINEIGHYEMMISGGFNEDIYYVSGASKVPNFLTNANGEPYYTKVI